MDDKTREERINELLNQSGAEAMAAVKGPTLADQVPVTEERSEEEPESEEKDKKVRVRASRLKALEEEADRYKREQQATLERLAALEGQLHSQSKSEDTLPDWWKEAYGDNELSRKGYENQTRIMREEMQRSLAQMEQERQQAEAARQERVEAIERSFDTQFETLEESLGRDLTDSQKAEIMDIVGEYSPQENGQYIGYMPIEKAYELWQNSQSVEPAKQEMAKISDMRSAGSTSTPSPERPTWGGWRSKYPGLL
ncbi:MAG: hypothetical protein KGL39_30190 [Patescibacteria group bacterium]|nr:hypothetical protein [Patescibacteria group bacterium]